MAIETDTFTAPACWASYLINGDASGLTDEEQQACDDWCTKLVPWIVYDVARDEDGDFEPRFTWSYDLYGGTSRGGDVLDYVAHKIGV